VNAELKGGPAFAYLHVDLQPGEEVIAESDAMATMDADIELRSQFNGGFFGALAKRFFGGESFFINRFTNKTQGPRRITLVQPTPGEVRALDLNGNEFYLQPGAFLACTSGIKLGLKWAGIASFIAREGLFKLAVSGAGRVWYGAYGALVEKEIDGEYIVDTSHLVAYSPGIQLKVQLAGGIFSSFFGGEGLVTRVVGRGKIVVQTRSLSGLTGWLNPRFW
jgi:uncharacterized protein (TIGR00266 family)